MQAMVMSSSVELTIGKGLTLRILPYMLSMVSVHALLIFIILYVLYMCTYVCVCALCEFVHVCEHVCAHACVHASVRTYDEDYKCLEVQQTK